MTLLSSPRCSDSRDSSSRRKGPGLVSVLSNALPSIPRALEAFDDTITNLMQDGEFLVRSEQPHWAKGNQDVLHQSLKFRARNPRFTPCLRRAWAATCLAGMMVWLLWDILSAQGDGLVPGIRDSFIVNSIPFSEDSFNNPDPSAITICSCTYNSRVLYSYPPYSMLVAKAGFPQPSFKTFLGFCDDPNNSSTPLNHPHNGSAFLNHALDEYIGQLTATRLVAPASSVLLSNNAWRAARFGEAFRTTSAVTAAVQAKINNALLTELPSNDDVTAGLDAVGRLHASFSVVLGRLLDMPDSALTVESVNSSNNQSTTLNCSGVPLKNELPLALQDWCPIPGAQLADNAMNCTDAYQAYVNFCAPALCQTLGPKSPYLQAMQIMSAIGGMYSIISLFAFALLWRAIYCSFERSFELDSILNALCNKLTCCGNSHMAEDQQQSPCGLHAGAASVTGSFHTVIDMAGAVDGVGWDVVDQLHVREGFQAVHKGQAPLQASRSV